VRSPANPATPFDPRRGAFVARARPGQHARWWNGLAVVLATLLLGACASAPLVDVVGDDARFVLPGRFSELTTRADLDAMFGTANVSLFEARDDDGRLWRSLVLFAQDPRRRAYLTFHDDANLAQLASIEVRDAGSLWRGKRGVRIGMSLAEVRAINGKPFALFGFDDRQRATVRDQWSPAIGDDATLGALDVDEGERLYFGVQFGPRAHPPPARDAFPRNEYLPSDDPRLDALGELAEVTAFSAWSSLDDEWQ
jgi:hypothetical protein